ncbi:ABC transporter substrate-binding protein [Oenococcus sicerae]|uniref:ABC transporter substrate-binding protein n=1 Tax=Oenococcus sicerae TaxID=2203724 RepID=A0AAJ1R954_9LACO|nr:ABC transporter substrate-binding protein [Oenococcus sicerae]MDN6900031.1 ABC transporter substrate-binding protein [Oenococcus sicerae]QAS69641.1 ABC transporter substrate-binding protein [Oenococcus sicerae]
MKKVKMFGMATLALLGSTTLFSAVSPIAASAARTKVVLWDGMTGPYAKSLDKIVKQYNNSQSKYTVVRQSQGNYATLTQKIMAAAKSKTLPDMAQATYTQVPDYEKEGIVAPLDSYMLKGSNKISKTQLKNIYPGFVSSSKWQGKYYSIPFSKSVRVMLVNQDLLKQLGFSTPKTWSDVEKISKAAKAKGDAGVGFDQSFDMELESLSNAAGTKFVSKNLKVKFASSKVLKAADGIYGMLQNGEAWTAGADIYGTNRFAEGKTALYFSSSAGVSISSTTVKKFKLATAVFPSYQGKRSTELAGNDLVMLNNNKKHQAGVWSFMKYLLKDKTTEQWAEATGYLPLTKTARNSASYKNYLKKNPLYKAAADSLPYGFQATAFSGYNDYRTEMLNAVDLVTSKKESPDKVFPASAKKMKTIISENK